MSNAKSLDLFRRLAIGVFAFVVLCGCGSDSPKDASDWSYDPPQDFQQQDKQKNGATVFLGPKDENFTANLMVQAISTDKQTAKELAEDVLKRATADSQATVKEQEPYTLGESDAYTWMISKTTANGTVAEQRQFIVKKKNVAVRFTLTATEKSMPQFDQELADSLKSFKWGR